MMMFVAPQDASGSKQNRTEKKSRKAIQRLGMKPVTGIVRVTVKKSKTVRVFGGSLAVCRSVV